jgi:hypothetical protein
VSAARQMFCVEALCAWWSSWTGPSNVQDSAYVNLWYPARAWRWCIAIESHPFRGLTYRDPAIFERHHVDAGGSVNPVHVHCEARRDNHNDIDWSAEIVGGISLSAIPSGSRALGIRRRRADRPAIRALDRERATLHDLGPIAAERAGPQHWDDLIVVHVLPTHRISHIAALAVPSH